ncbi:MAG: gamma-butyrobetaine hydroxylase-like domain-containing protein [Alphaproteobacteria bacterium]
MADAWPTELVFKRGTRMLDIAYDDGQAFSLPFELLRVESPSAEVQGHGGDQKNIVPGKRQVGVAGADATGNYAVRIRFDDGHSTGIFSWDYLYELGQRQEALWQNYLSALDEKGLSRDG